MDQNAKAQAIEQIKKAQNVLVTVSDNPSVDQLAAAIGFTLLLNKLNKHATAVFSGKVPSTIEFLKPEETLEGNTDSLRDFIISLDKNKADKLRYKVEDDVVRIYVTPYRTSINQEDLTFSQGDFNVDVVIALGVHDQDHLDKAIKDHGRILHDAAIVSVIAGGESADIGGINWIDTKASSLCEMLMGISESLKSDIIDEQIATALLTGIVAETERFSNEKTTPKAMTMSAQLMSAGANQQLISVSLNPEPEIQEETTEEPKPDLEQEQGPSLADIQEDIPQETEEDGVLNLRHESDLVDNKQTDDQQTVEDHHIGIDNEGKFSNADDLRSTVEEVQSGGSFKGKTIEPPTEDYDPGSQLPDLDGDLTYTPGKVTNAPSSAIDEDVNEQDGKPWHLPKVNWDNRDNYANQEEHQATQEDRGPDIPVFDNQQKDQDSDVSLEPPVPVSQGQPYLKPDDLPKMHGEDSISETEAEQMVKKQDIQNTTTPIIKPEHTKREFLDHPPSSDPGDEDYLAEEEKPSIEQGQPKFSKYIKEPPYNKDEQKLNALDGEQPEETINPLADSPSQGPIVHPQDLKSTEDPLLSTQHDAESAPTPPTTRHPRLYDDGVGVSKNGPLGASASDYNTLDEIEDNVKRTTGSVHGNKEDDARDAVQNALNGSEQTNPFDYLDLDSDPARQKLQQPSDDIDTNLQSGRPNEGPPPGPPPLMPPGMPS